MAFARRPLRRAAVRLCTMPLPAALSRARAASRWRAVASSASPAATLVPTFFVEVFRAVRTALVRSARLAFCRLRLIWDLMLAMSGRVYQRPSQLPGPRQVAARTIGRP